MTDLKVDGSVQVDGGQRRAAGGQLDALLGRLTRAERVHRGKAARAAVPRESHGVFDPPPDRPDPVALLEQQAPSRLPELVPIRYGRMLVSPFTYFRRAALPMASDLAGTPASGLVVQACGDAHLSNFGIFASPERSSCSVSTISMRRCPARGNGMSSGWPPAWRSQHAVTGSPARSAARSWRLASGVTGRRCGRSRA
jgi:hypothetical protein